MSTESDSGGNDPSMLAAHLRQCTSLEECQALYAAIPSNKKEPALAYLREKLAEQGEDLRSRHTADPEKWWAEGHFGWGMWIRNGLREAGFGEQWFHVANLDDIYVPLVEEALGLRSGGGSR